MTTYNLSMRIMFRNGLGAQSHDGDGRLEIMDGETETIYFGQVSYAAYTYREGYHYPAINVWLGLNPDTDIITIPKYFAGGSTSFNGGFN
jgi:hypothetical protein